MCHFIADGEDHITRLFDPASADMLFSKKIFAFRLWNLPRKDSLGVSDFGGINVYKYVDIYASLPSVS